MRAAAILLLALVASDASATGTVSGTAAETASVAPVPDAEIYVAELDGAWTVTREVRLRCETARGCAADLDGPTRVHVRFAPQGVGAVSVSSRIEDAAGGGVDQPALTLTLDGKGFGAGHIETGTAGGTARVLMLAVQAPGLVGPGARALAGDRI